MLLLNTDLILFVQATQKHIDATNIYHKSVILPNAA